MPNASFLRHLDEPVLLLLITLNGRWLASKTIRSAWRPLLAFAAACLIIVGPWTARNYFSVGKWGLTEEYGSATLIERFAYNDMTAWEFMLAFPYCVPGIGDISFDQVDGNDSMHRFLYRTHDSFFQVGRERRDTLVKQYGRLDPLIVGIALDELRTNWWRHLLVSIPLGWCGMLGLVAVESCPRSVVWLGVCAGCPAGAAAIAAVRGARSLDAWLARCGGESLLPLQPDPDRSVFDRRGLDYFGFAAEPAFAIANSRARTVMTTRPSADFRRACGTRAPSRPATPILEEGAVS